MTPTEIDTSSRSQAETELSSIARAGLPDVLAVNEANVPEVGTIELPRLSALVDESRVALWIRDGGGVAAFVLALDPKARYDSLNYRWFCDRYEDFLYVDRIAVAARCRGKGLGRRLYEAVFTSAREQERPLVTCEVNLLPPNPGSLAFHARLGFRRVGELAHAPGEKEVAMLAAQVDPEE